MSDTRKLWIGLTTLLPLGTMQLFAAINEGYWYARAELFMQQPIVELLVWLRVPGDVIFSVGAIAFTLFVIQLWLQPRREEPVPTGTRPA